MQLSDRIEVHGKTGIATLKAFGNFTIVGSKFLLDEGIGQAAPDGEIQLNPDAWYPLNAWLRALLRIGNEFGDRVLFKIGQNMVGSSKSPTATIADAVRGLDAAYHRSHRLDGRAMWDAVEEKPLDGIGRYGFELVAGSKAILSRCDNPYPCSFDHGILTVLARKYEANAEITHEPGPCRKKGQDSCTYKITWK